MTTQQLTTQESTAIDAWVRLLRGHAATRRSLDAQLQGDHGITVSDYEALLLLSRAEENLLRRVDLAEGLQLTPSGVTRLLEGLEQQGFVEKATCSRDARVTYAVLTEAGAGKLKEAACSHVGAIEALFEERYTKAELVTLSELLSRLPGAAAGAEDCTP
jgi:DNA-binding MarR family transcriptional regulator